jgi:hypothetical protein
MNICKCIERGRGRERDKAEEDEQITCKCIERGRGRERNRAEKDEHLQMHRKRKRKGKK